MKSIKKGKLKRIAKRLGEIHHHLNRFAAIDGVFFLNVDKKNIKNNLKNMI